MIIFNWLQKKSRAKKVACFVFAILFVQTFSPIAAYALTTGPSQPEVQSFEPVGTTDMVDMFTGDFVYNIPLLDVDGYPINISYHSGIDMEQEASWVGLGWNINPGVINRAMRGLPDDFNGEIIEKEVNIKDEKNIRGGVGLGLEILGYENPGVSAKISVGFDASVNFNNYRGVSADLSLSGNAGVNLMPFSQVGINLGTGFSLGVGSQSGADVDYHMGVSVASSNIMGSELNGNLGGSLSGGYNTRSGLKDRSFGVSIGAGIGKSSVNVTGKKVVPIALRNYLPVITNSTSMRTYKGQIKLGTPVGIMAYGSVNGMYSILSHAKNGDMPAYGYLYSQNANEKSIHDFTREKDGTFHQKMKYLPAGNMTYDVYSVSGQGTGGGFRPFRNDYGSVFDPVISSESREHSVELEVGGWSYFEIGGNYNVTETNMESGPWPAYKRAFAKNEKGSKYENVYFKLAGELTKSGHQLDANPIDGKQVTTLPAKRPGTNTERAARGSLLYHFTAAEASKFGVATSTDIKSYTSLNGFATGANTATQSIPRIGGSRKRDHISEVVQVEKDARRYVYAIPAMNNTQREISFAVAHSNTTDGLITYSPSDATSSNNKGIDNYYSKTTTPAFAHSYLLTSVLSADYVDIKGDGPTDDDFGSFTKFNYTLKNASYKWKTPYGTNKAQHNPNFKSDKMDDKANVVEGSREQWYMHSIESKNQIAEFYVSERLDALGVNAAEDKSYKLDSIILYNKNDRFLNKTNATPIKTVIFEYNYELCKGTPNSTAAGGGKLTLKKIFTRYGKSDLGMLNPYTFEYQSNYNYSYANRDRWGAYKPQAATISNLDFPYIDQTDANNNNYAAAWTMNIINLPSGGQIKVNYESDDYAFIQDKKAMEMMVLQGVGNSPSYTTSNQLFFNESSPNCYFYFRRDKTRERAHLSPKDNYLSETNLLYYNFDMKLNNGKYENIKGYANVDSVGYCPDGIYGFVKTKQVDVLKSSWKLPHPSYTAINFARYHLPHIIYPGNDPDESGLVNVLAGLKAAFGELLGVLKNPVGRLAKEGLGKEVALAKSFMRLNSPGLVKKGGGARVRSLEFKDSWNSLAGTGNAEAVYGKIYDYTTEDSKYGRISSGVASYEPTIGGDENPFRTPIPFDAQSASRFPPNESVSLYQELPVGETFYPSPVVGYSRVAVSSMHQQVSKSAQAQDIHEFYTARDFPIVAKYTPLEAEEPETTFSFKEQRFIYKGSQGFAIVLNDMHGKIKKTERRILKPGTSVYDVVSWNQYNYFTSGHEIANDIPVLEYDPAIAGMRKTSKVMGVESDLTIDTRQKKEHTKMNTKFLNLNVVVIMGYPVPIPLMYSFPYSMKNEFYSVTATKMVQKYGIVKEVVSFNEGALTTVRNEAFDPVTGQALITSVNNEFKDKEYSVSYPAYWGYKSMGPSYENIGVYDEFPAVQIENYKGILPLSANKYLKLGDELTISYTQGGVPKENNVWVTGYKINPPSGGYVSQRQCTGELCRPGPITDTVVVTDGYPWLIIQSQCGGGGSSNTILSDVCGTNQFIIQPRYKSSFIANGEIRDVKIKVVRSGAKNQLNDVMQQYIGMNEPFDGSGVLTDQLSKLISISAFEYADSNYAVLPQFDPQYNPSNWDSLNVYVNGTRSIKKVIREFTYLKSRDYANTQTRFAGLFNAIPKWGFVAPLECKDTAIYCIDEGPSGVHLKKYIGKVGAEGTSENRYFKLNNHDPNWVVSRTISKWSPFGYEVENKDAIGNFASAVFGNNNLMPSLISQNAKQNDALHEGFEDMRILTLTTSLNKFYFSPFHKLFGSTVFESTAYSRLNETGLNSVKLIATLSHTGNYCLEVPNTDAAAGINIPVLSSTAELNRMAMHPFKFVKGKKYIVSMWFRPKTVTAVTTGYTPPAPYTIKSNIIEGWQLIETTITVPDAAGSTFKITLPKNAYVDDLRIFPDESNIKAFVYHPVNQKLVATLDENNFASFFEYDNQGNLIRTKKETERGIMTINESRSAHPKK